MAALFVEALDTVRTLGWALIAWLAAVSVFAGLAVYAVVVAVACACRVLWRAAHAVAALRTHRTAPLAPELPASDSSPATAPERRSGPRLRPAPSWAHTQPTETEEAA